MRLSNARYGAFLALAVSFFASSQARIKGVGPFDPVGPSAALNSFRDLKTGSGQTTNAKKAGKEKKSKGGNKFQSVKEMRKEAEKEKNILDHPTYEEWVSEDNEQGRRPGNHKTEREKRNETAPETEDKQIEGNPSAFDLEEKGNSKSATTSETDTSPRDEDKDPQKTAAEDEAGVTMTDHSKMKKEHGPKSMREKAKKEKAQEDKERKYSAPKVEGKGAEQGPKYMREKTKKESEAKGLDAGKEGMKNDLPDDSKVEKPKKETRSKPDKPEKSEKSPKKLKKEAVQATDAVKAGRNSGYGSFDPLDTFDDILGTAGEETISEDKTTKGKRSLCT
jgi:hypothetical protein